MIKCVKGFFFKISPEDNEIFNKYKWRVVFGRNKSGPYLVADGQWEGKRTVIRFHRIILGNPKGMHIDHIDRNPLNCARENLRIVTASDNMKNRRSWKNIIK